jgi:hypothetical protein
MTSNRLPILLAVDDGRHFKSWCPFCRRWHAHGRIEGYRVAHCGDREHFPDGYEIRLAERLERLPAAKTAGPLRNPIERNGGSS